MLIRTSVSIYASIIMVLEKNISPLTLFWFPAFLNIFLRLQRYEKYEKLKTRISEKNQSKKLVIHVISIKII